MAQLDKIEHSVFVQRGDSSTLRVTDQELWYVVREVWQASGLLHSSIHGRFESEAEARAHMEEVRKEYANARR